MIVVDYNGIAISSVVVQKLAIEEDLIRHFILNTLRMYNKKFRRDYGQMVIACDSSTWRREYFPNYKFKRREGREKDEVEKANWAEIFRIINTVRDEIQENLPYRVVKVDGAEADDIIGALALETQEFGKHDDVMIVSADKDFVQLQKYKNVKQYSPMQKKFVTEKNPNTYLFEHVLKGDSGDGVPNVLSADGVFAEGVRQTPVTRKKIDHWAENAQNLESVMDAETYRNYMRNKKLIDLEEIPQELYDRVINTYESQEDTPKNRVLKYLISKRCKNLISDVEDFY
jgi:5'-3' exonuclease